MNKIIIYFLILIINSCNGIVKILDENSPDLVTTNIPDLPKSPVASSFNNVLGYSISLPKDIYNNFNFIGDINSVSKAVNYKPILNNMTVTGEIPLISNYSLDISVGLDFGNVSNATDILKIIKIPQVQFP